MKIVAVSVLFGLARQSMGWTTRGDAAYIAPRDFLPDKLADDQTWKRFICKGEALVEVMKASEDEAAKVMNLPHAQSEWSGDLKGEYLTGSLVELHKTDSDAAELKTWAYTEAYASYLNCDLKGYWAVESACNALGLDTRAKAMGGANICYNFNHWDANKKDENGNIVPKARQTYQVNNKEYRATGAEMQIAINPAGGVVFMQYVISPATAAQNVWNKKPSIDELPALRHLSDIMWGAWNRDNEDISKIKYFWVQGVGNTRTKTLIARALKEAGKVLEKWPGTTLDMEEDGTLAILGSENGACWGWFLAQHKKELGSKVIEKVVIFKNDRDKDPDPDLIFYVGDAPAQ
ncbi:hypothetical protein DPSP01_003530 [Paraphaeosphaeria sporulosa]